MNIRIITIFFAGVVFAAGLIMGFGGYVFASDSYNSSRSNTSTGIINRDVGNLLIDYGYGGEVINQVTEALARGTSKDELRAILGGTSARSPAVVEEVLSKLEIEFKRLGITSDDTQTVDSPEKEFTEGATPSAAGQPGAGQIEKEVSAPDAGGAVPSAAEGTIKEILPSGFKEVSGIESETEIIEIKDGDEKGILKPAVQKVREVARTFNDDAANLIENLKAAKSEEEFKKIRQELEAKREAFLLPAVQAAREAAGAIAQDLRDNFRENVRAIIGHVDHGKTARIAVAHGKGLRMINRYRSAIARFDHILGRLESRIEKIGIEIEAQALPNGTIDDILPSEVVFYELVENLEEAKNTQVLNEAKLVELQAKYESLLTGENPQRVAEEARQIAQELKIEIENLHAKLHGIATARFEINLR